MVHASSEWRCEPHSSFLPREVICSQCPTVALGRLASCIRPKRWIVCWRPGSSLAAIGLRRLSPAAARQRTQLGRAAENITSVLARATRFAALPLGTEVAPRRLPPPLPHLLLPDLAQQSADPFMAAPGNAGLIAEDLPVNLLRPCHCSDAHAAHRPLDVLFVAPSRRREIHRQMAGLRAITHG